MADDDSLSDEEVQDVLHRMSFELGEKKGATVAGDTALKTAKAALLKLLAGLIRLNDNGLGPPPTPS